MDIPNGPRRPTSACFPRSSPLAALPHIPLWRKTAILVPGVVRLWCRTSHRLAAVVVGARGVGTGLRRTGEVAAGVVGMTLGRLPCARACVSTLIHVTWQPGGERSTGRLCGEVQTSSVYSIALWHATCSATRVAASHVDAPPTQSTTAPQPPRSPPPQWGAPCPPRRRNRPRPGGGSAPGFRTLAGAWRDLRAQRMRPAQAASRAGVRGVVRPRHHVDTAEERHGSSGHSGRGWRHR